MIPSIKKSFDFWSKYHDAKKKPICVSVREEIIPKIKALNIQNFSTGFILEMGIEYIEERLKSKGEK